VSATGPDSVERSTFSEAASENPRGRPRVIPPDAEAFIRKLYPEVKSRRGLVDIWYRTMAMHRLKDVPADTSWLYNEDACRRGDAGAWQPSLLSELGRLDDDGLFVVAAAELCTWKPRTKDGVRWLREIRKAA
jgi:hypothetical protein